MGHQNVDLKQIDCQIFLQSRWAYSGSVENCSLGPVTVGSHVQVLALPGKKNSYKGGKEARMATVNEESMAFHWMSLCQEGRGVFGQQRWWALLSLSTECESLLCLVSWLFIWDFCLLIFYTGNKYPECSLFYLASTSLLAILITSVLKSWLGTIFCAEKIDLGVSKTWTQQSIVVSEKSGLSFWTQGTSLVVRRLSLCSSTAEGVGLIPAWGTKIQHGAWCGQKVENKAKKKKKTSISRHPMAFIMPHNLPEPVSSTEKWEWLWQTLLVAYPTAVSSVFLANRIPICSWYVTSLRRSHDLKLEPSNSCCSVLGVSAWLSSGPGDVGSAASLLGSILLPSHSERCHVRKVCFVSWGNPGANISSEPANETLAQGRHEWMGRETQVSEDIMELPSQF